MHKLGRPHVLTSVYVCVCVCVRAAMHSPNLRTSTYCLTQPYRAALPSPISAPRCTEAESRMEQSRVRWQWHPSHAMNNQWTPSGAYNRGAQLQSFTPGCLSLSLSLSRSVPHTVSHFLALLSHLFSRPPFPTFFPTHITTTQPPSRFFSHHLVFFSIYISGPCSAPRPTATATTAAAAPHAPQWPLWQASHGIPHSYSAVQFPGS